MQKTVIIIILSFFVSGCSTIGSINKSYSKLNRADGISAKEAKLIAKKALLDSEFRGDYRFIRPEIMHTQKTAYHPDHWFLKAKQKKLGFDDSYYFVVVNKKTGEVIYAKNHSPYPTDVKGYFWVFTLHKMQQSNKG